jgi:hypothetical protein
MTIALATVTNSIAALTVTGLTIKDIDEVPPDCTLITPVMFPEPLNFITNFTSTRDTFGSSTAANKTVEYDMNYTFLYVPVSSGRTGLDVYDEMMAMTSLILDDILQNDDITGVTDISPQGVIDFGPVPDPAGNYYIGCRLVFHIIEYV